MSEDPNFQKECECMQKRIAELENERDQQRKKLAELEVERDDYRRAAYNLLKAQESREDCEEWAKQTLESWEKGEGNWFTFEQILAQMEKAAETRPCPTKASSESSTRTA